MAVRPLPPPPCAAWEPPGTAARAVGVRVGPILLGTVLLLSACGGGARAGDPDVRGDWEFAGGTVDGAVLPAPAGARATLQVDDEQVRGVSFCNHYFSAYRLSGASLALDGLGTTDMGCEPEGMTAESAYLEALGAVQTAAVDEGGLLLGGDRVRLRFAPVAPVPDSALTGTRWVLETLVDGEVASSTVGEPAVLELADDGTLRGSTGCRMLAGTWSTSGAEVLVPELRADGTCPPDLAAQDDHVLGVLGDRFAPQVDADRLTVSAPDGRGLVYRAG
jgi:heat shock protein HslJ